MMKIINILSLGTGTGLPIRVPLSRSSSSTIPGPRPLGYGQVISKDPEFKVITLEKVTTKDLGRLYSMCHLAIHPLGFKGPWEEFLKYIVGQILARGLKGC
jgi:hypothetical protein